MRTVSVASEGAFEMQQGTGVLDCSAWWTAHTLGVKVFTNETKVNFYSKTTKADPAVYNTPSIVIYTSDEDMVNIDNENYKEYLVYRTDGYGWFGLQNTNDNMTELAAAGYVFETVTSKTGDEIIANAVAGSDCSVTVSKTDDTNVIVNFVSCGAEYNITVPVEAGKDIYCSITGEGCELSKLPNELVPETDEDDITPPIDEEGSGIELDCPSWWAAHTEGVEVNTDGIAIKFKNTSYSTAKENWHTPVVVVYSSDDGMVHSAGDEGYNEYAIIRSDAYAWCGLMNTGEGIAAWTAAGYELKTSGDLPATFVDDNKAGVECLVQAIRSGDKVTVQFTNDGITSVTTIPVPSDETILLSLSGELCKLTNIESVAYVNTEVPIKTPTPLATYPLYTPTPTEAPALPSVAPEPTPLLEPETLTGTAWWTGNQTGRDYTLKGEGTLDLYITYSSNNTNEPGAFNVELLSDGNKYITTGSDINIWTAEGAEGTVSGGVLGGVITVGHVYKVSITRTGYDFTIVYYDLTDNKEFCTLKAVGTNQGVDVNVHVMAQVGTYIVSQTEPDSVAPAETTEPTESPEPDATTAPDETTDSDGSDTTDGSTTGGSTSDGATGGTTDGSTTDNTDTTEDSTTTKKTMKISSVTATKNTKKVKGTISVKNATVKVKVGSKAYKKATVSGKKFTFKASAKLKKGTTIKIKATKSGYKAVTKSVKVK